LPADEEALFDSFFTSAPPLPYERYTGDKIRMRYFGHACILVETRDISILLDPVVSYYGYQHDLDRFSDTDLPDVIDYVLITHNHQDHILFETLLPLRHRIKNIVVPRTTSGSLQDPNLRLMFNTIGFNSIVEIDEMQSIHFKDCTITGIPFIGEHCDLNIQSKLCHHVKIGAFSMLFAADSCNVEPMLYKHVSREIGDIDVLFLGMECEGAPLTWLYGPLLTDELPRDKDDSRRLAGSDFEEGKALVQIFNPAEVYVYAMGQEPWLEFISSIKYTPESHPIVQSDKLIAYCRQKNIIAERLFGEKEILYSKTGELV
jgi:L-ascorbate metabolism protein UlaG (beta-lactamase superfamily)